MTRPLLSICIPTYNRCQLLDELLDMILPQAERFLDVEVCVSDNHSSDDTTAHLQARQSSILRYWTNEINIGGDRNFLKCIAEARGEYVWLVGDDDIIPAGAIASVLQVIRSQYPDLIVSGDGEEIAYDNYAAFLEVRCRRDSWAAMAHTLISANVFRHEIFDMDFAVEKLYTQYAHMFGLMKHLDGKVVAAKSFVKTRPVRAEFAKFPSCLCVKQAIYMRYLAERFDCPRFKRYAIRLSCNLPMEYGSRIKNFLLMVFKRIRDRRERQGRKLD